MSEKLSVIPNNEENVSLEIRDTEISQKNELENNKTENKSSVASMRNFYVIASGYLFFTLTDSGLRMIILFELYNRKYNVRINFIRFYNRIEN